MEKQRIRLIKRASWAGILGNGILAIATLLVGFLAGSFAVIGVGIDTATDIVTSFITLFAARIISKPPDRDHPYGHRKAEAIAAKLVSFIIFFAGAQLAFSSIRDLAAGTKHMIPAPIALYIMLFSVAVKIVLSLYKFSIGKKTNSSMLIADAKNMRNDVLLSLSVFIGLFFTITFSLAFADLILALFISFFILRVAYLTFMESANELLEGAVDEKTYQRLFGLINSINGASRPHRLRIRKMGEYLIVDLDIEVSADISVKEGHAIAQKVEKEIKNEFDNIYDILVHIEPEGNIENEPFGLCEQNIKRAPRGN